MISPAANPLSADPPADTEVRSLDLEELYELWRQGCDASLRWDCLFVTPPWLEAWHRHFGRGRPLSLTGVFQGRTLLGIAPLMVDGATAGFAGDVEVCDYLDFVVRPGLEALFFNALIEHLRRSGIDTLDLRAVRADAAVFTGLAEKLPSLGIALDEFRENQSLEMQLAVTWESYLQGLKGRQRHEVRRKLRRLHESGDVRLHTVETPAGVPAAMDRFAALFTANRSDKFRFWDSAMDSFFRTLAALTAREGLLRLLFLELNGATAATVMCFDYNRTRYLYNSGYDRRFSSLSVGLLCKVASIRQAVDQGLERYDFLKGAEVYKERLGGTALDVYRCRVGL